MSSRCSRWRLNSSSMRFCSVMSREMPSRNWGSPRASRRPEFGGALRDSCIELGIELLQRVFGLTTPAPVIQKLFHGARHVGNLIAAVHRDAGLNAIDIASAQCLADTAQSSHDMASE